MNPPSPTVSVAIPVSQAFEWTRRVLFQPFDFYRWLAIGFTAWLASLGEWSGGGGGGGTGGSYQPRTPSSPRELWDQTRNYVVENVSWLVPITLMVVTAAIALGLLILWLSSRGRFMFVHNVSTNRDDIVAPWHDYQPHGNSLFWFRLVLALAAFCLSIPLIVLAGVSSFSMINAQAIAPVPLLLVIVSALALIVLAITYALAEKFTKDFIVPIMWMRQPSCRAAWAEFGTLLQAHPGSFALYILFHILLTVGVGALILAVVLLTCCIAGCLFALPYLGTVLLLPVFVFFRSYSLLYLAQYGPDYNAFQAPFLPNPCAPPSPGS